MFTQLSSLTVLFWFRKSEAKNQQNVTNPLGSIQCRISISGIECEIGSTKIQCFKAEWDAENQMLTPYRKTSSHPNQKLASIAGNLTRLYDILCTKYEYVTPHMVKEYYLSKKKFTYSFAEIAESFFQHRTRLVKQGVITQSTLDVNNNYTRHIIDYTQAIKADRATQVPQSFFSDLFEWLSTSRRCGLRTGRKVICFAKQLLKYGKKKGMCPHLACFDESLPGTAEHEDYIDTTHLTVAQLDTLIDFDFFSLVSTGHISEQSAHTLTAERDAFVFNCFSGMHHCDYSRKEFAIEPYAGELFLRGKRQKTKKSFAIKLLEPAVNILRKYNNQLTQLPTKSNQKRNDTLKLIALYVGIPLRLTTKVARKTFCDLALNEMLMPADDVAACLGLTSTKYLKNYGRIRERRLLKTMKSWSKIKKAA